MDLSDPNIQAALINSTGSIVAAIIAAICASLIGKQIFDRKELQSKLNTAMRDIEFLLAVEERHCALHVTKCGESFKHRMRKAATSTGLIWSGLFTPGRVKFLASKD